MKKMGLASIEVGGHQLHQKSLVPHKTTLYAKFHVFSFIGGNSTALFAYGRSLCSPPFSNRRGFEGVLLGVCSSVDVTQSEGDLPDFNQSEH